MLNQIFIGEAGWYYTLSAIPQTLAAMIALAATCIMFKLTYIKQTIREDLPIARWFLLKIDPNRYDSAIMKMSKRTIAREFSMCARNCYEKAIRGEMQKDKWHVLWEEFSDIVDGSHRSFASHPEKMIGFLVEKARLLEKNVISGQRAFAYLRRSIFFTTVPILFSLFFLPLHSIIAGSFFIVGCAVVLALWGVAYTSYSVWKISPI